MKNAASSCRLNIFARKPSLRSKGVDVKSKESRPGGPATIAPVGVPDHIVNVPRRAASPLYRVEG